MQRECGPVVAHPGLHRACSGRPKEPPMVDRVAAAEDPPLVRRKRNRKPTRRGFASDLHLRTALTQDLRGKQHTKRPAEGSPSKLQLPPLLPPEDEGSDKGANGQKTQARIRMGAGGSSPTPFRRGCYERGGRRWAQGASRMELFRKRNSLRSCPHAERCAWVVSPEKHKPGRIGALLRPTAAIATPPPSRVPSPGIVSPDPVGQGPSSRPVIPAAAARGAWRALTGPAGLRVHVTGRRVVRDGDPRPEGCSEIDAQADEEER